ncbi:CBS domain-containing protein [Amycolatopsis suaedae]|uniref:CBS domain-containing protein n=1 Tax=Amycolatopsis suaedae TaxID=2510978 RepID=UPI0030B806EE
MATHGVSAMPVVDEGGRVIGVVSEADLLPKQARTSGKRLRVRCGADDGEAWGEASSVVIHRGHPGRATEDRAPVQEDAGRQDQGHPPANGRQQLLVLTSRPQPS